MALSDAISKLGIVLGHWKKPSAWDRVKQDEPLDPVEGSFEPTVPTASTGPILITITGSQQTSFSSDYITRLVTQSGTEVWSNFGPGTQGTNFNRQPGEVSTAYDYGNLPTVAPLNCPYATNRQERKILEALGDKLPAAIERAVKIIGKPEGGPAEWNRKFFEFVSRGPQWRDRPRERSGHARRHRAK